MSYTVIPVTAIGVSRLPDEQLEASVKQALQAALAERDNFSGHVSVTASEDNPDHTLVRFSVDPRPVSPDSDEACRMRYHAAVQSVDGFDTLTITEF